MRRSGWLVQAGNGDRTVGLMSANLPSEPWGSGEAVKLIQNAHDRACTGDEHERAAHPQRLRLRLRATVLQAGRTANWPGAPGISIPLICAVQARAD